MIHRRIDGGHDLLQLHAAKPQRYPFLLESVAGHPLSGRYDILFAFPGHSLQLDAAGLNGPFAAESGFLSSLDAWASDIGRQQPPPLGLPFAGGWFLYLAYELGAEVESAVNFPGAPGGLPVALAVRIPAAIIRDRQTGVIHVLAESEPEQLEAMLADLRAVGSQAAPPAQPVAVSAIHEEPPAQFLNGVHRILDYLAAGDAFQINLSRRWLIELESGGSAAALALYEALRRHNPAPFAGLMHWQDAWVLSSSPERLVEIDGDRVQTRPIAGTRPRGSNEAADLKLRAELLDNLKERAEHIMLIDLERNDLGRVCEPGSVQVSELMTLESYAHVHHIVSNVAGTLRDAVGPGDVLRAVFPGGTITGCPKVRAMQIIAELEIEGRGAYTGAMGYLSLDGRLDTNILIRSLMLNDNQVWLRAGAGIVADSDPEAELSETRAKARGLLNSLGLGA